MNFDTAFGAAITSLFIANIIGSEIPHVATAGLIVAILAIYNFDHLLDAKKINGVAIAGRHRFYQRNITHLAIYQLFLLIALLVISWFVPTTIAKAGIILAVITLIYFLLLFIILPHRFVFKELMIAAVFSCGLFLGPISLMSTPVITFYTIMLWLEIFLLALANTLIFSWFDYENDMNEGHSSLAQIVGSKTIRILSFLVLTILAITIIISMFHDTLWSGQLIIFMMGLVLLVSLMRGKKNKEDERLRIVGEAIFLIPLVYLIF
jgi:4-hydroxybenzoate polyprenyltransferase